VRSAQNPDALAGSARPGSADRVHLGHGVDRNRLNHVYDLGGHISSSALPAEAHPPAPGDRHDLGMLAMRAMHIHWHDTNSFPWNCPPSTFNPGHLRPETPAGRPTGVVYGVFDTAKRLEVAAAGKKSAGRVGTEYRPSCRVTYDTIRGVWQEERRGTQSPDEERGGHGDHSLNRYKTRGSAAGSMQAAPLWRLAWCVGQAADR
jgi:hypothetical protein